MRVSDEALSEQRKWVEERAGSEPEVGIEEYQAAIGCYFALSIMDDLRDARAALREIGKLLRREDIDVEVCIIAIATHVCAALRETQALEVNDDVRR